MKKVKLKSKEILIFTLTIIWTMNALQKGFTLLDFIGLPILFISIVNSLYYHCRYN